MAYDIIGDIHGQADELHALLVHMGYEDRDGAYRHPSRTAIFVGDFIDKGPQQVESVMIVRNMVRANTAQAVMGNHEFNAIAWHTPDPDLPGEFLRQHGGEKGEGNRKQHEAFLAEVKDSPSLHKEIIDWFMTLPLWLDLPGIRVVHACWHDDYMRQLNDLLTPAQQVTPELMVAASRAGRMEYLAVEWRLCRQRDSRHTHATHALAKGAELTTVRDNLRHASVSTTSVYLHTDQAKRARQMRDAFGTPNT